MAVTKVVSIEVTDLSTKVIEMGFGKKDQNIYKAVIFDTPAHTVTDGVIENPDVFGNELTAQLKTAGIHTKDCIFSLNTSKVISREVTTADLKDEQIPDFIESQKGEYFPMDTTGFIMVHRILERNKEAKTMRLNVFGIPGRIVQTYQEVAAMAGLKVLSMDYSGNAMYQWLQNESHKEIDIYLHIAEQSTTLSILDKRVLALQRNLNFGSNLLADRVIGSGYYQEDLNRKTAMLKLEDEELVFSSISGNGREFRGESEAAEALNNLKAALTEGMKQFINNVSRVLEYYHTKAKDSEIAKIYVGGPGARVKGLKSLLENEFIGVEIIILEQLPDLKLSHAVAKSNYNTTELISCIGAVDCSLTFVLPSEKAKMQKTLILCVAALVLVVLAAAVVVYIGKKKYDNKVQERDLMQFKVTQLEETGIEKLEAEADAAAVRVDNVYAFDDLTYRMNEEWASILKGVEEKSVKSLVLSSMTSTNDTLTLNAVVDSKEAVAKLILQLSQIPYFDSVRVSSLAMDTSDAIPTYGFTAVCKYKYYFNPDVDGDGKVDVTGDVNGDGVINELDFCRDWNNDGEEDRRDIEKWKIDKKADAFELIKNDINHDGVVDELDDVNGNGVNGDEIDRKLFQIIEAGIVPDYTIAPQYELTPEQFQEIFETYGKTENPEEVAE